MSQCISRPILRRLFVCAALCTASLLAAPIHAQALYGSIVGNVNDAQGATVPGVTITATNTGTGLEAETVTDADGAYTFRNLLPGHLRRQGGAHRLPRAQGDGCHGDGRQPGARQHRAGQSAPSPRPCRSPRDTTLLQTDKADLRRS